MLSIPHTRRKILLRALDGRPAGMVCYLGGKCVLHKRVDPERHQLRNPPAWAEDGLALAEAERAGAEAAVFESTGRDRRWTAPLRAFRLHGFEFDRGAGRQVALPLAHWHVEGGSGQMQLPFGQGDGSEP